MSDTPSSAGRFVLSCILVVATLGFGLAGLCGAVFTAVGVSGLGDKGPDNFSGAFLVISIPSLLIGGGLAWLCGRKLAKLLSRDP